MITSKNCFLYTSEDFQCKSLIINQHILIKYLITELPWLPEVFLSQSDGIGEEKPLVQAVEFFENAGPMGCRFLFPESDFDPRNSIGSRNLSVLTSTLIGLATESSSNRFSILVSTLGAIHSTKIPTGPTGKRGPPQKVDQFFRNFSGWTEPIH